MGRAAFLAAGILIIGVGILALSRISVTEVAENDQENRREASIPSKATGSEVESLISSAAPDPSRPQPVSSPNEQVGKKQYDTGIRRDARVQPDRDGKNIALEGFEMARRLHSEDSSPEEDLEILDQILGVYRLSFQYNPEAADNEMVMEALIGNNPNNLVIFPENHPDLNQNGQLQDRWGTPYFFHALSGTEMEIFSAGPDLEFNTDDDILRTYRDGNPLTGEQQDMELDLGL